MKIKFFIATLLLVLAPAFAVRTQVVEGGGGGGGGGGGQGACDFAGPEGTLKKITRDFGGANASECFGFDDRGQMQRYSDIAGNAMFYNSDSLGRLTTVQDSAHPNRTWVYNYDAFSRIGNVTHVVDGGRWFGELSRNQDTRYIYDSIGNVTGVDQGPQGAVAAWTRMRRSPDEAVNATSSPGGYGSCVTARDPNGRPARIRVDGVSEQGSCENGVGEIQTFFDNARADFMTGIKDALNNETRFTADPFGRLAQTQNPDSSKVAYQYNDAGLVTAWQQYGAPDVNSGQGRIASAGESSYDVIGRPTAVSRYVISADGVSAANNLANLAGQTKLTSRISYDEIPQGIRVTTRSPGAGGEIASVSSFDNLGRPTRQESPESPVMTYSYNGNVVTQRDANNLQWTQTFDNAGRLAESRFPSGYFLGFDYDSRGVLTQIKRNGYIDAVFDSDDLGRTRKMHRIRRQGGEDAVQELQVTYDAGGNMTELKDPANNTWRWEYASGAGRWLSAVVDPAGGRSLINTYDNAGRVTQTTDARGTRFTNTFDRNGRLTGVDATMGDGSQYHRRMTYNGLGLLNWIGESRGANPPGRPAGAKPLPDRGVPNPVFVSIASDSLGRTLQEQGNVNGNNYTTAVTYNNLDEPVQITLPNGVIVSYQYTAAGFLRRVEARGRQGGNVLWSADVTYQPATGRYERIVYNDGTTTTLTYDAFSRLIGWQRTGANNQLIAKEEFRLRPDGKVSARLRRLPQIQTAEGEHTSGRDIRNFGYDYFDRLVLSGAIDEGTFNGMSQPYSLVAVRGDNVVCDRTRPCFLQDDRHNLTHRYLGNKVTLYSVAADNSLAREEERQDCTSMNLSGVDDCRRAGAVIVDFQKDANGNMTTESSGGTVSKSYFYDAWNRLERMQITGPPIIEIRYEYDGLDRLVRRRTFQADRPGNNARWTFLEETLYLWNGGSVVETRIAAANGSRSIQDYVYGVGNGPAASIVNASEVNDHVRAMDGTLMGLRRGGNWREWYSYGLYGGTSGWEMRGNVPANFYPRAPATPILFRGLVHEPVTGLYSAGGRWFSPSRSRYLSRHPGGPAPGRMNLYRLLEDDPVTP